MNSTSPNALNYPALRLRVVDNTRASAQRAASGGALRILRQVQRSIEDELKRLPARERGPVACRAGCDFCCHLRVMATPVEVFALLDFLKQQLDKDTLEQFVERVEATDAQLRALDEDVILKTNLPCPVLVDGRCSGYAGRPLNCRSYHSLSREACEESFEHPEDLDRGHPQLRGVAAVHEGAQAGFQQVLRTERHESRQYELVSALAEAIADDQARARFERGEPAFLRPLSIPET